MRQCYNDVVNNVEGSIAAGAEDYAALLHDKFSADKMYEKFVENVFPARTWKNARRSR